MKDPIPYYEPKNFYEEDPFFGQMIQHYLPAEEFSWAEPYFKKMGQLAAQEIAPLILSSDQNPPKLQNFDATGKRIDQINYHESYRQIAKVAYEFGIIGLGHSIEFKDAKRRYGPLLKFGIGYLFSQAGSVLYCPICMTDGSLQLIERHASEEIKKQWIPRITSLSIETFTDGGMYLTEVQGGSDVGANTCEASEVNGVWILNGKKWFCSNAGSKTAMVLARLSGAPAGTSGLGLFLVPLELENGERNGIQIDRIKDKLGTCEMATAEITLIDAVGYPIGELDKGFSYMTEMLNLSRTYNAIWSIGLMQRAYLEAKHYAAHRQAFGKNIEEYPLVQQTLNQMKLDSEQVLCLVFETLHWMEQIERGENIAMAKDLLRLLTPVIKFYTAEKCIESAHRAIEILGGNGCVEDFPVAKILRDSQILAIWEGTANILSLDLLRCLQKTQAHQMFLEYYSGKIKNELPTELGATLLAQLTQLETRIQQVLTGADGCNGQLECRILGTELAQFLQKLAWQLNRQASKTAHRS